MRPAWAFFLCCLIDISAFGQDKTDPKAATARAALLQQIRDRIVWYDQERTNPLLIPGDVIGLVPLDELPVSERDREGIQLLISFHRDWRSPTTGERWPECTYPRRIKNPRIAPEKQTTIEEVVAKGPVSMLVSIDRATVGYWPDEGIFHYNEVTPLKILVGADFAFHNPLHTIAFLSPGGEVWVEGTRLCSVSPWHTSPPREGETYLLVGAPDRTGIFYHHYYFRVVDGMILPATYSSLNTAAVPVSLDKVLTTRAKARD